MGITCFQENSEALCVPATVRNMLDEIGTYVKRSQIRARNVVIATGFSRANCLALPLIISNFDNRGALALTTCRRVSV